MKRSPSFAILAVSSGFCIFATATIVTSCKAASVAPAAHISVSEDSGAWRRKNPFIENTGTKNGRGTVMVKNSPLLSGSRVPAHIQDGDIHVQGIMQADRKFHALINGRTVKVGDTIGGITVKEIHRYKVVVVNERKEKIVYDIYQGRIDRGIK